MAKEPKSRIEVHPDIHFGKPCVAGTRIPVLDVLALVAEGISFEGIIRDYYPDLDVSDVQACVRYAMEVVGAEDLHVTTLNEIPPGSGRVCRHGAIPAGYGTMMSSRPPSAG